MKKENIQRLSHCTLPSFWGFLAAALLTKSFKSLRVPCACDEPKLPCFFFTVYINICWITDWENNIWRKHFPLKVVGTPSSSVFRSFACQSVFFFLPAVNSDYACTEMRGKTRKKKDTPPNHMLSPFSGRVAPLSRISESCHFGSLVASEAEASLLTVEESLARLSLSLRVKAVTDPNAYTVVAAFRFLIAAWLVSSNEGSGDRIISAAITRVSQANYFLFSVIISKTLVFFTPSDLMRRNVFQYVRQFDRTN